MTTEMRGIYINFKASFPDENLTWALKLNMEKEIRLNFARSKKT